MATTSPASTMRTHPVELVLRASAVCVAVSLAAGVAACSAQRPRTAGRVGAGMRVPAVSVRSRTFVAGALGPPRALATGETDAAQRIAVGGVRVEVRGDVVAAGEQAFAGAILGATRARDGRWIFVTDRGTVARSETFVGQLTFVRTIVGPIIRCAVRSGELWVEHDRHVFERASDGVILPDSADPGDAAAGAEAVADETVLARAATAALARAPYSRLALPSVTLLSDGLVALRGDDAVTFASVEPGGGLRTVRRADLMNLRDRNCTAEANGSRLAFACRAPEAGATGDRIEPFVVGDDRAVSLGRTLSTPVLFGRDGQTITIARPCDAAASANDRLRACTHDTELAWRTWEYPRGGVLLDVHEHRAVVMEARDPTGVRPLFLYDIDTASAVRLRLSDPVADVVRAGFLADGRVMVLARIVTREGPRSLAGISSPRGPIVLSAVGIDAVDATMADAQHGFAIGRTARDLAETLDGAITWQRVEAAFDGDARRVVLSRSVDGSESDEAQRLGAVLQCARTVCRAGPVIHYFGAPAPTMPVME